MATITSRISAMFDNVVNDVLMKHAEAVANDARANAPTARIKAHIKVSPVEDTPNGKRIKISVSLDEKDGAPEARAYELGSGIHGEYGTTYPINARNTPNLVFFWEKKGKWFVGPHVDHPGVEARPYLAPAVDKNRNTLNGLLTRGLNTFIGSVIETGFQNK